MAKTKSVYICSNCGSNYAKMMGKCFSCGEYNTIQEETVKKSKNTMINLNEIEGVVTPILNIEAYELQRLKAPGTELNGFWEVGLFPDQSSYWVVSQALANQLFCSKLHFE